MISKLLQKFPEGYDPNPSQVKLLKNIDDAFENGHKFVICNAPTGSGKSLIIYVLMRYLLEKTNKKCLIFMRL